MFKPPSNRAVGRFCSFACRDAANIIHPRPCETCGKTFRPRDNKNPGRFCSRPCYAVWLSQIKRGAGSPQWKGGTKDARNQEMRRMEYRHWRTAVFERDEYTCQGCGQHGGTLNAHHRVAWKAEPALRYDIANGLTLCDACHRAAHRKQLTA